MMYGEQILEPVGHLFYLVSPNRTTFRKVSQVPPYVDDAIPSLVTLFLLEICVSIYTKRSKIRLNDSVACLSQAILMEMTGLFAPGGALYTYLYIYRYWRLVNLPWNSLWTWWFGFLAFDFMYYWGHRTVHGVNILWATHHVHHSSEDYNISTQVRQSILQHFFLWVMYIPVAFFVPASIFIVHSQFGYLYQFWIHTELIKSLGPLEYVLNTPSHHRVHHGRNRNCIDKNFGGTLIIWDRLFGTFEAEKEEVLYGLTHPVNSFDLFKIQFDHCVHMWKSFWMQNGLKNKLSVLFKGPGWSPGKPWHGLIEDIPDVKAPVRKYDVQLPFWCKIYVVYHFLILVQGHLLLMESYKLLPSSVFYGAVIYQIFSLYCIGILLDRRSQFPKIEVVRCLLHFLLDYYFLQSTKFSISILQAKWFPETLIQFSFMTSLFIWFSYCVISAPLKDKKGKFFILNDLSKKIY